MIRASSDIALLVSSTGTVMRAWFCRGQASVWLTENGPILPPCRCLVASAMTAAVTPALLEVSAAALEPMVKTVVMVKVMEAVETTAKEYAWLAARRTSGIEPARISRIRGARVVITWLRSAIYRAKQQRGKHNLRLHVANPPYPVLSIFATTMVAPSPDGIFCVSGVVVMVPDRLSAAAASTE